ncbi:hypothetical protein BJ170DRAFT_690343 [Xylariales sp. AK1849]|nr:hypothetical protein BJ170DRAFT_690343 [Xylariales sp. AK1849]
MPAVVDTASRDSAAKYWGAFLQGFKPCDFPTQVEELPPLQAELQETTVELAINSHAVQELCSQHHVTLASLFQTAWAIVIGCYAGVEDVSFGYSCDDGTPSTIGDLDHVYICRTPVTAEHLLF